MTSLPSVKRQVILAVIHDYFKIAIGVECPSENEEFIAISKALVGDVVPVIDWKW
jgi:hypothetical protein